MTTIRAEWEERVAVSSADAALTYAELHAAADQLAVRLRRLGVGPEVRVGICLERSVELVVAVLGVWKAGGAYLPLDPGYPADRLAYILADSGAGVVVTTGALEGRLPAAPGVTRVRLDEPGADGAAQPAVQPAPEQLAYVIYTSGSTGRPKGVGVTHRALANHMRWMQDALPLGADDRVLQKTPFGFDASVWEIVAPLLAGARLVLARPGGERDPEYLVSTIAAESVTVLQVVPSLLRALLECRGLERCGSLRRLLSGGELLPAALAAAARERLAGVEVVNLYGPTEVCIDATWHRVTGAEEGEGIPIGRPVTGVRAYALDAALRPVGEKVPGELYLGGAQVARGYLGRAGLTADRFVPDPYAAEPGARMYRTGDRVRWRAGGELDFLGRVDDQVKLRGFRMELGEVEAALARQPGVRAAAAAVRGAGAEQRLVGYVVAEAGASASALREAVGRELPEYMVPQAVMLLERLPLSPNGKLDRQALPEPEFTGDAGRYQAPRTATERALAGPWGEVLGVERVGVHDSFFDLGGHSLLAMQVASRIRDELGIELPLHALFTTPTIAGLAEQLDAGAIRMEPRLPAIVPAPRDGPAPLSFAQEQVWFLQRLHPESKAYHYQTVLELNGALDPEALRAALQEIVRRHEIFRTTFPEVQGRPVQQVHEPWTVDLPVVDLRSGPREAREGAAHRRVEAEIRVPFYLDQLPLVRWTLLRLDDERYWLAHVEQHLVHDGWSFHRFLGELLELYRAFAAGLPSPLPELEVQFADFAGWQRSWIRSESAAAHLEFWRRNLEGAPPLLALPRDRPRPPRPTFRGTDERVELSAALYQSVGALARTEQATPYMVMLAAFLVLLRRYTGEDDLCVGSGLANRRLRETEPLLGMLVNMVVMRTDLSGEPTFRELVRRVRTTVLDAQSHQEMAFDELVRTLKPERNLGFNPIFQVGFSFHDAAMPQVEVPGLKVTVREGLNNGSSKFDMDVVGIPRPPYAAGFSYGWEPGGLTLIWTYSVEMFEGSTIRRMLRQYLALLAEVVADADRGIAGLPLLAGDERREVLGAWSGTLPAFPADRTLHECFAEQVRRTPGAVALVCEGSTLSYRELDAAAERLARGLRGRGVGPEVRVALCAERSAEMVVGVLGILKAGGAYVPLDPSYPADRLRYVLADSRASLLLTQEALRDRFAGQPVEVVCIGEAGSDARSDARPGAGPGNLAYVIYTSGSTGMPKGVAVEHRAAVNHMRWMQDALPLGADDRVLQKTPFGFDASVWELFAPLLAGARLVLARPGGERDPEYLVRTVAEQGVTVLQVVPSLLGPLLAAGLRSCRGLRRLFSGGEPLPGELARTLAAELAAEVVNLYGPTEVCIDATWHRVTGAEEGEGIPIGRPVAGVRAYVLDAALRPVPTGVPGELYLGGAQVARGYLGRPGLTASRFVPDPYAAEPGARMYRTGDRVRWRAGGELDFLGRVDDQVKLRGFRIEPGEIEEALRAEPGVRDAVVVVREDTPGDRRLVAYVVAVADPAALRDAVRARLPEYMVPAAVVVLDALPLTPNGKVDRKALPAPEYGGRGYVGPRTEVESALAGIWAEVLGVERVGVEDDFFALGGHSLLATQVVARVRDRMGAELPLHLLFRTPTVVALAPMLVSAGEDQIERARSADEMLERLDQLSAGEVERLLSDLAGEGHSR
ncbi:MAG TPA: amino acid adenylation domain-containing protein [Longimicrobium sp.]